MARVNKTILHFRLEGDELDWYEQFKEEHKFKTDGAALRYIVKMQVQVDNLIKNRPIEFAPNTVTALDKMSKLELASLQLGLVQMLGEDEVRRILQLAKRK